MHSVIITALRSLQSKTWAISRHIATQYPVIYEFNRIIFNFNSAYPYTTAMLNGAQIF